MLPLTLAAAPVQVGEAALVPDPDPDPDPEPEPEPEPEPLPLPLPLVFDGCRVEAPPDPEPELWADEPLGDEPVRVEVAAPELDPGVEDDSPELLVRVVAVTEEPVSAGPLLVPVAEALPEEAEVVWMGGIEIGCPALEHWATTTLDTAELG